jgi:N-acetyl-1-D-myo-inositol-2-amino-2-deoxy-alpha-D-glucopyranoside deacetylase
MSKQKTLIFVGGHPDDETFGLGGTLAQYAAAGVKVYYISATRGEVGTISPELLKGGATPGDIRWSELECAAKTLGLAGVVHLGYRDSGMPGSEDNRHPEALAAAPIAPVTGRLVKIFRELKPEVVVTFDPIGGYRHPDHIAIHNATVAAFHAAGDPKQFPEAGVAFQPQKLYFHFLPHRMLKLAVSLMPIFGKDPHKFGKNGDIDLASLAEVEFPVHAVIHLTRQAAETRDKAVACYVSQNESRPPSAGMMGMVAKFFGRRDSYMRAYPPPDDRRENDLFQGVV